MKNFLCRLLDVLYPWITKLNNLVTIRADQVIVLFEAIRFFILGKVLAELMFAYQIALYEQIQRIVNGSTTDPVILGFHADVKRFNIKMTIAGIDLLENSIPFRRFS
jgi:hypothetical protein